MPGPSMSTPHRRLRALLATALLAFAATALAQPFRLIGYVTDGPTPPRLPVDPAWVLGVLGRG